MSSHEKNPVGRQGNRGMRVKAPVSGTNAYSMCTTDEPPKPIPRPVAKEV